MIERDPKIVKSGLSRTVKKDGVTVEVSIIRLEHETEWSLEVVIPPARPLCGTTYLRATTKPSRNLSGLSRRKGSERSSTKKT